MSTRVLDGRACRRNLTAMSRTCSVVVGLALTMAACGSSKASPGGAEPADAVSGFVDNLRKGDGAAACAFLSAEEQALFVTNAAGITPALDDTSCKTVVESFHAAKAASISALDGSFENFTSGSGTVGSGDWVFVNGAGQQRAAVAKVDNKWLIQPGENDFPTALLHYFD